MRGTRKKLLCAKGLTGPERRKIKRKFKYDRVATRGTSPDTSTRKPSVGGIGAGHYRAPHVTRTIEPYFGDLTQTGMWKAVNLRFQPYLKHGAPEALRKRPRGLPGTGRASWLDKPQLLAEIAGLQAYRDVNQTYRGF